MGKRTYFVSFLVLKKVRMGWNWTGLSPREQKGTEREREREAIWNEPTLLFDQSSKETGLSHEYLSEFFSENEYDAEWGAEPQK